MKIIFQSAIEEYVGEVPQIILEPRGAKDFIIPRELRNKKISRQSIREVLPLELTPKAKLTDLLNGYAFSYPRQLIVSAKLFNIITSFNGPKFDFREVQLKGKEKSHHDYIFINYYEELSTEIIDFTNSIILNCNYQKSRFEEANIHTMSEYLSLTAPEIKQLKIRVEYTKEYDYFQLHIANRWVISDAIYKVISREEITGLSIYDFNETTDISLNTITRSEPVYAA